jgi:hypothetical protein
VTLYEGRFIGDKIAKTRNWDTGTVSTCSQCNCTCGNREQLMSHYKNRHVHYYNELQKEQKQSNAAFTTDKE